MTRVITIALIAVCCVLALAAAYPSRGEKSGVPSRLRSVPPSKRKYPTAIAHGYASSIAGADEDEVPEKDEPENNDDKEEEPQEDAEDEEEPTPAPVKPTRPPRAKPVKPVRPAKPTRPSKPVKPEEDEEEQQDEEDNYKNHGAIRAVATSVANGPGAISKSHALAIDGLPAQFRRRFRQ